MKRKLCALCALLLALVLVATSCAAHGKTIDEVQKAGYDVGVAWQDGRMFHGPCHIRMNLALPLSRVQEAFERLNKYVFNA